MMPLHKVSKYTNKFIQATQRNFPGYKLNLKKTPKNVACQRPYRRKNNGHGSPLGEFNASDTKRKVAPCETDNDRLATSVTAGNTRSTTASLKPMAWQNVFGYSGLGMMRCAD